MELPGNVSGEAGAQPVHPAIVKGRDRPRQVMNVNAFEIPPKHHLGTTQVQCANFFTKYVVISAGNQIEDIRPFDMIFVSLQ